MAYHWAISPLLTDSIASLQTCAALEQYLLCGVKCSFGTVLLNFVNLSKMTQGDTPVGTRDLSNCCRMLYLWAISLSHGFNTITANECSWRQLSIMFVLRSQTFFCDCASHLYNCVQNYIRGHPDSNQGAFRLQLNALPLSYIPSAYRFNNITANALRSVERWNKVCCSKSSDVVRLISLILPFQNLYRGTPVRTRVFSNCSRMPYHWAVSPLLTDSIASLQTCAALEQYLLCGVKCSFATVLLIFINLSKMTQGDTGVGTRDLSNCCRMLCDFATFPHVKTFKTPQTCAVDSVLKEWFVFPNGMFVRFWSHLCHLIQIYHKGISEFEPGIPRTASQWSTTELCHGLLGHPSFERCHLSEALHLRYGSSKFFFFFQSEIFIRLRSCRFCQLIQKFTSRGILGSNQGPLELDLFISPSYIPFLFRYHLTKSLIGAQVN